MFSSVPTGHLLQGDRHLHLAGQVRVVELVRVADALVRRQLEVGAAERVALAGGEVRERHLVGAADLGVQVVNLAGEPVRRQPLGHRVGVEERPIDPLGRRAQHAVKSDGVRCHGISPVSDAPYPLVDRCAAESTQVPKKSAKASPAPEIYCLSCPALLCSLESPPWSRSSQLSPSVRCSRLTSGSRRRSD